MERRLELEKEAILTLLHSTSRNNFPMEKLNDALITVVASL
jgi:hypothetical protein